MGDFANTETTSTLRQLFPLEQAKPFVSEIVSRIELCCNLTYQVQPVHLPLQTNFKFLSYIITSNMK